MTQFLSPSCLRSLPLISRLKPRACWPKWLYLYFILAGGLLFALSVSLYFNHRIINEQREAIRLNHTWEKRSQLYAELRRLGAEVNLPGNDIFESGNAQQEQARMERAMEDFNRAFIEARRDLQTNVAAENGVPLLHALEAMHQNLEAMVEEAKLVFQYFDEDRGRAGQQMAAMDRQYDKVRKSIYAMDQFVSKIQDQSFAQQDEQSVELAKWAYGIYGFVLLLVPGIVGYAVLLSRQLTEAARLSESNLALLRENEEVLRKQSAVAESSSRAKSAFLANMSHEIRTPMGAIMGYAEMLLEPDHTDVERREAVQVIRRSARHLLDLINDILDISKIEAERMTVERIETNIPQIVADVASVMRPSAIGKGLGFRLTFGEEIPRFIQSDPIRVKQVLVNLVGNGVKFTERGEIQLHVSSRIEEGIAYVDCDVRDTGIGLSDDQINRIFQPFTQADESTTRRFGGTGLGLTISSRLAELLQGSLTVRSLPGLGSIFRFTIHGGPACGVQMLRDLRESQLALPESEVERKEIRFTGNVLLVEDGPDNQRLISGHLRKGGAEVTIADNGKIALELVKSNQFDLILMDMQMPVLDGYAAASELRRLGCKLPIIALTAHAMAEDRGKCLGAGCTEYLTKPIEKHALLSAVACYLNAQSLHIVTPETHALTTAKDVGILKSSLADDPEMEEVIEQFVGSLPSRVAQLSQLLEEENRSELRRLVHQLKGAGGGYGFPAITHCAGELEQALDRQDPSDLIQANFDSLIHLIQSVEGYKEVEETINA